MDPVKEAEFFAKYEAECQRKEKLMDEFEKLEKQERKRKKPNDGVFRKKYERLTKGLFYVEKIVGDHLHLVDEEGKKLGVLHANSEVSQLIKINDGLEGTFGFRDGFWRAQFIFCIVTSMRDIDEELDQIH